MRALQTKKKKRGEHQKPASHDDEYKNKASAEPPSKVRAIGARRHVRVKKKKKERRKRNKKRNTKPQTKKTRPRTTGKRGMTTKYVTAPCVIHIVSTATHTWMRKPSMLRRRAPKGQHRTQKKKKRTTNRHARQKARPQTQTTTIYPPYLFLHRPRPPRKKKKSTKAQKVWGGHGQRGNNEKANKRTFTNHEETTVWRASMLTIRGRAPKGRTTHTRTHINKTAKSEKTETRARKNKV